MSIIEKVSYFYQMLCEKGRMILTVPAVVDVDVDVEEEVLDDAADVEEDVLVLAVDVEDVLITPSFEQPAVLLTSARTASLHCPP